MVNSHRSSVAVKPVKNDESESEAEAASLTLKLTATQERFSRLCSEYTTLGKTCSKPGEETKIFVYVQPIFE